MQPEQKENEKRLFDQAHTQCCQCPWARRRVSEAMRRSRLRKIGEIENEEILWNIGRNRVYAF